MTAGAAIEQQLRTVLSAEAVEVVDESALHAGHAGAREGGHFAVTVVSRQFADKGQVERHRMIYAALGDAMRSQIHALSIRAFSPNEL
ncbi:MAG: BolA family protein [Acidiferrobacterales bacterium]